MKNLTLTIAILSLGHFFLNTTYKFEETLVLSNNPPEMIVIQFIIIILIASFWIMTVLYTNLPKQMYILCIDDNKFNPELNHKEIVQFCESRIIAYLNLITLLNAIYLFFRF